MGLPGGFWGWSIQWNHAKCCGANPCCRDNEIWARRGDPATYRLVSLDDLLVKVQAVSCSSCVLGECRYREIDESHQLIQWFWEILESFSNDERILFMRFVSGRSRLPMNPADITQRFQILKIDRVKKLSYVLTSSLFCRSVKG